MRFWAFAAILFLAVTGSGSFHTSVYARCPMWDPECEARERFQNQQLDRRSLQDSAPTFERPGAAPSVTHTPHSVPLPLPPPSAPTTYSAPTTSAVTSPDIEEATSVFVGPHNYPPREYGAYEIVAFPSAQTSDTRPRFIKVCEAYVATLPPASTATVSLDQQMATVWPVTTPELAERLSRETDALARRNGCGEAVDRYDLQTSLTALRQSGSRRPGNGPFLLAWSPASTKGKKDALVLVADLSNLETDQEFLARFQSWRDDIESNPEIFKQQWTVDRLVTTIRNWADHWGNIFLSRGALL